MYTPTAAIDRAAEVARDTGERCYFGTIAEWAGGRGFGPVDGDATRVYFVVTDHGLNANATISDNFREHGYAAVEDGEVYASFIVTPSDR